MHLPLKGHFKSLHVLFIKQVLKRLVLKEGRRERGRVSVWTIPRGFPTAVNSHGPQPKKPKEGKGGKEGGREGWLKTHLRPCNRSIELLVLRYGAQGPLHLSFVGDFRQAGSPGGVEVADGREELVAGGAHGGLIEGCADAGEREGGRGGE